MSFPEIKTAIEGAIASIDTFKAEHGKRLDSLQDRLEELESKALSPGKTGPRKATALTDAVQIDGTQVPVLRKGSDFHAHYAPRADAEELDGLTLADFMRAVAGMKSTAAAAKALSVGTGSAGGYAVPTIVMPDILQALTPASAVLQAGGGIADVSELGGKGFNWAAVDSVPAAAWRSEAGAVAESDPAFREVATTPRSLSFYFKISRELLADAANMDAALRQAIAQAFAKELDRTALRGSGSAPEPRGVLNTTNVGAVTNGGTGATQSSQRWTKMLEAVSTILAYDAPMPTAAIMAPRSLIGYAALADTTNQPLLRPQLLGNVQFLATSQVPVNLNVGGSTDCTEVFVGDFTRVMLVMRERPTIMLANELFALNGQVGFVCHVRADIAVLYPRAFAIITGIRAG